MKRKYLPDMTIDGLLIIAAALRRNNNDWLGDENDNMSADENRLSRAYDAVWDELERRGMGDELPGRLDAVQFIVPLP